MIKKPFKLVAPYKPCGDQPKVIQKLTKGLKEDLRHQVLWGVTGAGKTFTMANVIAEMNRPTLVISHNKTLAAQLASEFKVFFPENAVEYFVSYYDYYQPEAYIPRTDTFIEKDSSVNEDIDRLRHSATHSLLTRRDVIIVASVSCIYGLGNVEDYQNMCVALEVDREYPRRKLIEHLLSIRYERNDVAPERGSFRVKGDIVDIFPAYEDNKILRVELWGDEIEKISWRDALTQEELQNLKKEILFPASHYVIPELKMKRSIGQIRKELKKSLDAFEKENKVLEYQRLKMRVNYDIEMMKELGYCAGIENYSRYFSERAEGEKPFVLLDFFPDDFLVMIDESHVTVPQVRGMYYGDRARKETLVEHAFRLPSALDNRPLKFKEFETYLKNVIYVSATPADYELEASEQTIEQIIRPTGLLDPEVFVRPLSNQVEDLVSEIQKQILLKERTLVTTLTKKMSEDLTKYLQKIDIKVKYMHSDIETLDRIKILKDLRSGEIDVLVGVNLLREGLDLPEVSLVAILDADKEGFLRNERSLVQTIGRAARNVRGRAILYADNKTGSILSAIEKTKSRRLKQQEYNQKHGKTPESVHKKITTLEDTSDLLFEKLGELDKVQSKGYNISCFSETAVKETPLDSLEKAMKKAADELDFEKAAVLRDQINQIKKSEK
ncbi:excinuclease ABC subunit B [PVC group bacterium (ex Bugula neritina AB1)]|nr:excinuclease ABC subunit B [PVC group bacterium (ex Bugula neritina AB1)]